MSNAQCRVGLPGWRVESEYMPSPIDSRLDRVCVYVRGLGARAGWGSQYAADGFLPTFAALRLAEDLVALIRAEGADCPDWVGLQGDIYSMAIQARRGVA
jgi:hypothetical protein